MDDLLVAGGETVEKHMELVQRVFERLREVGLKCHPEKCCFAATEVEYLGMWLRPGVVSPQVAKVATIAALPRPTDVTSVRTFLGVVNYYRQFIPDCSRLEAPLNALTKKGALWEWGPAQEGAFRSLKEALQGEPVLVLPKRGRPFRVRCDWSKKGVGGVLLQEDDSGVERVMAYGSRSCNGAESRYSSFEGELLAAVYFVRLWRQYLYGERFQLESDHQPLQWILTNSKLIGKLARWALMLSEFDFEVVHKPGVDNEMDCLSRFPQGETHDSTWVRQEGELEEKAVLTWPAASCLAWAGAGSSPWMGAAGLRGTGATAAARAGGISPRRAVAVQRAGPEGPSAYKGAGGTSLEGVQIPRPGGVAEGDSQVVSVAAAPAQDVWQDSALLALLRGRGYPLSCGRQERDRLQHRARGYEWRGTHLVRRLTSGEVRVVPELAVRGPLIQDVHERIGHVGVMKTRSLLTPHYWWLGLSVDVARVVGSCSECDRVRAAFNVKHPTLQPLSIKGLFYRWGLDFAGPLPESSGGNKYVLVMVEHFSKTVVLVPTRDKEPGTVAAAFTREVLTRYGACAEVVTDRGGEFRGCIAGMFGRCAG
jgi:hypothetical protein